MRQRIDLCAGWMGISVVVLIGKANGKLPSHPAQVSDRRFGALKTLGERKAAFHEYVAQRRKEEAEEARQRRMQVTLCRRCNAAAMCLLHSLSCETG